MQSSVGGARGDVDEWEREEDELLGELLGSAAEDEDRGRPQYQGQHAPGTGSRPVETAPSLPSAAAATGAAPLRGEVEVEEEDVTFGVAGGRICSPAPTRKGASGHAHAQDVAKGPPEGEARAGGDHSGSGSLTGASSQAGSAGIRLQDRGLSIGSTTGSTDATGGEEDSAGGSVRRAGAVWEEDSEEGSPRGEKAMAGRVLAWDQRVRIAAEVASALLSLHDHNFLHCDLKPGNVLLDGHGSSKLVDLGLARPISEELDEAQNAGLEGGAGAGAKARKPSFTIKGTMGYIDPHRIQTGEVTPLSDVYALSLVLLQLLLGLPLIQQLHSVLALCGPSKPSRDHQHATAVLLQHLDPTAGAWPLPVVRPRCTAPIALARGPCCDLPGAAS